MLLMEPVRYGMERRCRFVQHFTRLASLTHTARVLEEQVVRRGNDCHWPRQSDERIQNKQISVLARGEGAIHALLLHPRHPQTWKAGQEGQEGQGRGWFTGAKRSVALSRIAPWCSSLSCSSALVAGVASSSKCKRVIINATFSSIHHGR